MGEVDATGHRDVIFDLNGAQRVIKVKDKKANVKVVARPKADKGRLGSVGAPMPGMVVEVGEGGRHTNGLLLLRAEASCSWPAGRLVGGAAG